MKSFQSLATTAESLIENLKLINQVYPSYLRVILVSRQTLRIRTSLPWSACQSICPAVKGKREMCVRCKQFGCIRRNKKLTSYPMLNTQMAVCLKPKHAEVETDRRLVFGFSFLEYLLTYLKTYLQNILILYYIIVH